MSAENGVVPALIHTSVWRRTSATWGSNVNWCPEFLSKKKKKKKKLVP